MTTAVMKLKVNVKTVHSMADGLVHSMADGHVCYKEKSVMVGVTVRTAAMSFPVFATIAPISGDSGLARMVSNAYENKTSVMVISTTVVKIAVMKMNLSVKIVHSMESTDAQQSIFVFGRVRSVTGI